MTEDWSNGCWKFSFAITEINYIFKYTQKEILNYNNILQYYCFCICNQINEALLSKLDLFQKHWNNRTNPKLLNGSCMCTELSFFFTFLCVVLYKPSP